MKFSFSLLLILMLSISGSLHAQLSNTDLLNIQDETDARRAAWNKGFDEGVAKKSFAALPGYRTASETYIDQQLSVLRRMYASGDARELLTAVSNYLQIQKQFVKSVMIPAESLNPADEEEISKTNQRISDFAIKEKTFLMDINNALRNSPEPMPQVDPEMNEEEPTPPSPEEIKKKEESKPKRKGKLPHEQSNKEKDTSEEDE